jgi:hypothetical protein
MVVCAIEVDHESNPRLIHFGHLKNKPLFDNRCQNIREVFIPIGSFLQTLHSGCVGRNPASMYRLASLIRSGLVKTPTQREVALVLATNSAALDATAQSTSRDEVRSTSALVSLMYSILSRGLL